MHAPTFANDLGKYFVKKIETIQRKLNTNATLAAPPASSTATSATERVPLLTAFKILSVSDVQLLVQQSVLKSCKLNPAPSRLVSKCDALLPVITTIVNISLQTGHFPECWKEALVKPVLEKPGLDIEFMNFRPLSNLTFISKLTEKAVFCQINNHMVDYGFYPIAQSSYRRNYSTETALLRVKNDILLNINRQHVTLLVLLDLSAAIDTVDHNIMLETLHKLGFKSNVLEWFRSYLSGRCQRVSVRECQLKRFHLNCGIPQGSCLGPLLFTIYSSSLLDVIRHHLPSVHCYADDTQLYVSFSPADKMGQSEAIAAMERCVQVIRNWISENRLLMNEAKTEFILIGTRQQLAKVNIDHVKEGNVNIAPHSPVKNLGVWFDSKLSMEEYITKTRSAAFYHLYNIRRIQKYFTKESTETLIHAYISSRLDYCNSLLYGTPACHLHKLQRVQNAAARLVFQEKKYCRITLLFKSLHWLPVKYRIIFKILLITFKAIHGLAPSYVSDLISVRRTTGKYNLRTSNSLTLKYSFCKSLATLGDRSFHVTSPKLWNYLPGSVRNIKSVNSFKKAPRTYLFTKAF